MFDKPTTFTFLPPMLMPVIMLGVVVFICVVAWIIMNRDMGDK